MATRAKPRKAAGKNTTGTAGAATPGTTTQTGNNSTTPTPAVTTFPPLDCSAGLPASESFHDVTFAEFKRINRRIDDLPYPIVLAEIDASKLPGAYAAIHGRAPNATQRTMPAAVLQSSLKATGGVPLSRFLDKSLSDLHAPLVVDVNVKNVGSMIDAKQVRVDRQTAKLTLSDDAIADLLSNRPAVTPARIGRKDVLLRLVPPEAPPATPLLNEYAVGTAEAFIRYPVVSSTDGAPVRVKMNAAQLGTLTNSGMLKVTVGGRKIVLRTGPSTDGTSGVRATASYAATATVRSEGLESESTRSSGNGEAPAATIQPKSAGILPLALYLPWRHRWILRGYSRGELLHSLALGPQEEVTIEISTWDRRKRTFEDSAQSEFEQTLDFTDTRKDTESVVREVGNQTELGLTAGGNIGFKVGIVDVSANSTASAKNGITNSSKNNLEILRESVTKATNKLKLQRETKVSETSEIGTENKVTRKVRNPNMCHTLTLNYYEVLAHYGIVTEFNKDDARLCVLDDNPIQMDDFNDTNMRYYESVLRRVLLVPDLAKGFDAARKLYAQAQLCEAERRNETCHAMANLDTGDEAARQQLVDTVGRAVAAYKKLQQSGVSAIPVPSPIQFFLPVFWPILTIMVFDQVSLQRWMYLNRAAAIAPHLFEVLGTLSKNTPVSDSDIQELAEAFNDVKPSSLSISSIQVDTNSMYWLLRRALSVPPVPAVFTDIPDYCYTPNDAGLMAILNTFMATIGELAKAKQAAAAKRAMDANQESVQTDYTNKEIAEALESVEALRFHLNQYRNYYRTAILTLMPFPDAFVNRLGALPMVERRVVGFDADQVALPINAALDPRTDLLFRTLVTENEELLSTRTTQPVTLPTSGIHVETRRGNCNSCEDYIVMLRRRDLQMKRVAIDLKQETLAQQKLETARLQARIEGEDYTEAVTRSPTLRLELDPPIVWEKKPDDIPPAP